MKFFKIAALFTALAASMPAQRFGPRANGGSPPDPATLAADHVTRLTTLLSLTAAQVTQATTIFTNAATALATVQTSLATDRDSLQTAVKSNATSTIDQLANSIGVLQGQVLAIQSKANAAFYAILTADQKTKFDQLGPRGFGGPGPGGPPPGRP